MAKPKVFISSTCYDLGEIRESLSSFIKSFGFDPILSERGDVFYHPDLHTHDSCIHEVGNCQLFILIIGGRFGGSYVNDMEKSVTNAEYDAAILKKIPVFTYVKRGVIDNHHVYHTNRNKEFISEIEYPSIENQKYAQKIFEFINKVRRATTNNSYESFVLSKDIENHLRKQWAGLFFDFLKNRELNEQILMNNEALTEIHYVSEKVEEMLKKIYLVVDEKNAKESINDIEIKSMAKEYLLRVIGGWNTGLIVNDKEEISRVLNTDPKDYNWYEYLVEIGTLSIENNSEEFIDLVTADQYSGLGKANGFSGYRIPKKELINWPLILEIEKLYESGYKILPREIQMELLSDYLFAYTE